MSTTSLPSFAQTFSSQSLASIPSPTMSLARLAPIVNRNHSSPSPRPRRSRHPSEDTPSAGSSTSRKRSREDTASFSRDDAHRTNGQSSHSVRIKEEQEQEMLDASPPPTVQANPDDGLPPLSASNPSPSKKRRVTVSGAPNPLNTDVRVPLDQSASTPISPVVMGFTIKRDNPTAIEQVKSMITVKQQQKALIEQRRGSIAGVTSTSTPPAANSIPNPPQEERNMTLSKPPMATRSMRRSPNAASNSRRLANAPSQGAISAQRPPSPSPIIVSSQQTMQSHPPPPPQVPIAHSLPPPPISFARRRAAQLGAGKKKPADILISPREVQTKEQFQPAIQSAPPVPHAGQASFYSGRFSMTIPRLPSVLSGTDNVRRVASNVPPTPTRLAMQRTATGPSQTPRHISDIAGRSPPAASVPIASSLVPPTPSALQHPGYSGDKAAFLAPFEIFYDALNDSKQLKNWLGEQLQRSNTLMQTLTQQQEKLNEAVEALVEKKTAGMRMEMTALQRRVEELEDALRVATSARRPSIDTTGNIKSKGKSTFRNGLGASVDSDGYTFPPTPTSYESSRLRPEPINRSSPGWAQQDKDSARDSHHRDSDGGTPTPYDAARQSSRMDASRTQASEQQPRSSYVPAHSPSHGLRQHQHQHQQGADRDRERGGSSIRNASSNSGSQSGVSPPLEHQHLQRREDGRRNSVIMSPPGMSGDDG